MSGSSSHNTVKRSRRSALLLAAGATLACIGGAVIPDTASAVTLYWAGGASNTWNLASNWSTVPNATTPASALLPTANDNVVFNISTQNAATAITVDNFQFGNNYIFTNTGTTTITAGILNGANPFSLNIGNIAISGGGITVPAGAGRVSFGDGVNPTNDPLVTINGRETWTNQSSSNVVLNLASSTNFARAAGSTINFNQSGTGRFIASSSVLQNSNGIVGPWAFFGQAGTGSGLARYATNVNGTLSTYTGATAITDATGLTDTTGSVNYSIGTAANVTVTASPSFNTLLYTTGSATITFANGVSFNGLLNVGGNSLVLTGTATGSIGSTKELVINCDKSNSGVTIGLPLTNNATGTSSLIKTGIGILTINNAQTFTGGIYVTQGTLTASKTVFASGSSNPLTVSSGATFMINGTSQNFGALNGAGTIDQTNTANGTDTLTVGNGNGSGQFDGNINNTANKSIAITKVGSGFQAFTGTNAYKGNTTVNGAGGVLLFAQPSSLPGYDVAGRVSISNGYLALRVGDGTNGFTTDQVDTALSRATKSGTLTNGGFGIDTTNGDVVQWATLLNNVPTNFGFVKAGLGTFTFNQSTSQTGSILVRTGTLAFTGTASVAVASSLSTTLGVSGVSGGAINYSSSASSSFGNLIVGNGTSSQSTFSQSGGTVTATTLTLNNGFSGVGQGIFNLTGGTFNVGSVNASNQVAGDSLYSTINITGGAFNVSSAFRLTGNPAAGRNAAGRVNQTDGTVSITGGLVLARTTASNTAARRGEYNLDGGRLIVDTISQEAGTDTFGTLNLNGGILQAATNTPTFLTGITQANVRNGGARIDTAGSTVTISQVLAHSNVSGDNATDGGLTKSGTGTLILAATPTYTGPTTISAGTLQYGDGTTAVTLPNLITNSGNLAINRPDDFTYAGTLAGTGSLSKLGSNALTLTGSTAYTGDTTVTGGKLTVLSPLRPVTGSLVVTGPGAVAQLNAPSTTTSASGYTLAGQFASVSVTSSGKISLPVLDRSQNKASVLLTNSLSIASNGVLDLGNGDLIIRGGAANLTNLLAWAAAGSLTASGSVAIPNTTLAVFVNDSGDGVNPYFSSYDGVTNLQVGDVIVKYTHKADLNLDGIVDGKDYKLAYEGLIFARSGWLNGDNNYSGNVTLDDFTAFVSAYNAPSSTNLGSGASPDAGTTSSIPEPTTAAFVTPALLPMMSRRRRSRRYSS
jgi:autotransporter-associated beta strand protein